MPDTEAADAGPVVKRVRSGHGAGWLVLVVVFVLLFFGYVLGGGPMFWLFTSGRISLNAYRAYYAPVIWVCEQNETVASGFEWYLDWWQSDVDSFDL